MNLLGLLLKAMTAKAALQQIAKKTGLSEKQIKRLIMIATPLLIKYMTQNASSGDGASSLLGALMQHTSKKEMDQQLKEADETDGKKIIGHIFGKKEPEVTQSLSAQSGLTAEQVNQILAIMAPAILEHLPRFCARHLQRASGILSQHSGNQGGRGQRDQRNGSSAGPSWSEEVSGLQSASLLRDTDIAGNQTDMRVIRRMSHSDAGRALILCPYFI